MCGRLECPGTVLRIQPTYTGEARIGVAYARFGRPLVRIELPVRPLGTRGRECPPKHGEVRCPKSNAAPGAPSTQLI